MLISGKSKFLNSPFTSEDELKKMVVENADYFFGSSSFCLSRELISDKDGFDVFTDGFAVDIANKQWFVVNVGLAKHDVWSHIVPQVVKQLVAADQSTTKQLLNELIIQQLQKDTKIMKKFNDEGYGKENEGVFVDEIRDVLREVFGKSPIIGMPIDSISKDLRDWTETLKTNVKLCIVKQYVDSGNPESIIYEIPEEFHTAENGDEHSKNTESSKITKLNAREKTLAKQGNR